MRLLKPKPVAVEKVDDPNPSLVRGPDEECQATWWHQATPGTTYWRCLVPARHLPGQSIPVRAYDILEPEEGKYIFPRMKGDTAIWQFLGDDQRSRMAFAMKKVLGNRLLMEVDDNYTRLAPYMFGKRATPWKATIADAGAGYSHEMHRILLPKVDAIICATDYLADVYSEFNENIFVCRNSIDPADWEYEREEHDAFRIVYYGSPSHLVDAPIVTKALKWAAAQKGVEVWTVGFENPSWSFPHQKVGWIDSLAEARKSLFRFDLGVAPLKRNDWSNGKSDIKALEYAMAGVLPLMSRAEPFRPWFDVAPDLVLDDDDWMGAVRWAVKNQDDVRARAQDVKEHILAERTIHTEIDYWRSALLAS